MPVRFQSLAYAPPEPDEMLRRARAFYERVRTRRSVRDLSDRAGSREVIERVLCSIATAPSPTNFLRTPLNRPENERPAMIVVTGYPENGARGPALSKEAIDGIGRFV